MMMVLTGTSLGGIVTVFDGFVLVMSVFWSMEEGLESAGSIIHVWNL